MTDLGLQARMIVVGGILFLFYLAAATMISVMTGISLLPVLLGGILIIPPIQYKLGKWMALRGAEDLPEDPKYQHIHQMNESLARDMGVKTPRLMITDMGQPNAFAVGRKGAGAVVLTPQIIQLLERDELEGVIAHEIAHIKNRDSITMVIGQSIGMIVGYVAYFAILLGGERNIGTYLLAIAASTLASMLVTVFVLAISRYREYVADADAKQAVGSGDPLARALEKLNATAGASDVEIDDGRAALCIINADRSLLDRIFATHPPSEKRIARLRS